MTRIFSGTVFLCMTLLVVVLMSAGCNNLSQKEAREVVATVADHPIFVDDFLLDFTLNPQFQPNVSMRQARLQHIRYMQDQVIKKMAGEAYGLDTTELIRDRLDFVRKKEMLKALFQKEVLEKLPISEEEAWEEYKRSNIEVRFRHLFARTKEGIDQIHHRLSNGDSFESLAAEIFRDSTLAKSGGDLGFMSIGEIDPLLADSVYNQRVGIPSPPLRSSMGYHIVKVEDVKQTLFLSRESFKENQDFYKNNLRRRRADLEGRLYLSNALAGKEVSINPEALKNLLSVNENSIQLRQQERPLPVPNVSNLEISQIFQGATSLLDKELVRFGDQVWSVEEFLRRLKEMPPLQRPEVNKRAFLIQSIIDLARDELLLEIATAQGLEEALSVKRALANWRQRIIAREFEQQIILKYYQRLDPDGWRARRKIYHELSGQLTTSVDTTILFRDLTPEQLNKPTPKITLVLRDQYLW